MIAPGAGAPFGPVTLVAPRQELSAEPVVAIDARGRAADVWQTLGPVKQTRSRSRTPLLYAIAGP